MKKQKVVREKTQHVVLDVPDFFNKCRAGSVNGEFCVRPKGHNGFHVAEGLPWYGNYDQLGIQLIKAINKHTELEIEVTEESAKIFGEVFEKTAEIMDYNFCPECDKH